VAGIGDFIAESDDWGIGPRLAQACLIGPALLCLLAAISIPDRPLFDFLTAEDSVFEWLQVSCFAIAAVAAAVAAFRLRRVQCPLALWFFALLSVGNVFITGEEVSWGQRLLGFGTPESIAEVNHQDEVTLHNITKGISVQFLFNMAVLVIGLGGMVVPWLLRRSRRRERLDVRLVMPPRFLGVAFLMAGGYRLGRLVLLPTPRHVIVRYGEITELCLGFAFAMVAVLSIRRIDRVTSDGPDSIGEGRWAGAATARRAPIDVSS
jgi:hypothetical protein